MSDESKPRYPEVVEFLKARQLKAEADERMQSQQENWKQQDAERTQAVKKHFEQLQALIEEFKTDINSELEPRAAVNAQGKPGLHTTVSASGQNCTVTLFYAGPKDSGTKATLRLTLPNRNDIIVNYNPNGNKIWESTKALRNERYLDNSSLAHFMFYICDNPSHQSFIG